MLRFILMEWSGRRPEAAADYAARMLGLPAPEMSNQLGQSLVAGD
jgi:hypothetical protein